MYKNADPALLLRWYDRHARSLPWRVPPGSSQAPDPYKVWLSEIMLQQTGVAVVQDYFARFLQLWPDVNALAAAPDERVLGAWAGLGYYARARNLIRCARQVAATPGSTFPDTYDGLIKLPGVGPYTAAAIAAIAFGRPETVVDGNVERVMARLFAVTDPLPDSKPALRTHAGRLTPAQRPGDYAQAVMDLGATICTPKNPKCGICPWNAACLAREKGIMAELPARRPKAGKPVRYGTVYLAMREDGAWLLERRRNTGLLGGMLGWPGNQWAEQPGPGQPPVRATWHDPKTEVRHTFTHFHLRLDLRVARVSLGSRPDHGFFIAPPDFRPTDLPSVMRKAHKVALAAIDSGLGAG